MLQHCFTFYYRIPLIPRRPVSPDPNAAGKGKGDKGKAKPAAGAKDTAPAADDTPQPPEDIDVLLLTDAHQNGYGAIDKIVSMQRGDCNS